MPAGGGINFEAVISGHIRIGNNTFCGGWAGNDSGPTLRAAFLKKVTIPLFDSLSILRQSQALPMVSFGWSSPLQQDAQPSPRLADPLRGPQVRAGQCVKVDPLGELGKGGSGLTPAPGDELPHLIPVG